jgi:CheY-like chemotaxis protein
VLCDELSPDVLILDLRMPKKDGQAVITELVSRSPRPRIIVLTNSAKAEDLRGALTAGAKGYLLKGAERQQVWDTIREVFAGKSSLSHDVAAELADTMAQARLSKRQLQVLKQVALGRSGVRRSAFSVQRSAFGGARRSAAKRDASLKRGLLDVASSALRISRLADTPTRRYADTASDTASQFDVETEKVIR